MRGDYERGYGNGKALGHALHSEEALAAIRTSQGDPSLDYRRGIEDGFSDGWEAWRNELDWMQQGQIHLVHQSWDTRHGPRYKPPAQQGGQADDLPHFPDDITLLE